MHTQQRFHTIYKKIIISYALVIVLSVFTISVILRSYASELLKNEMISGGGEAIMRIGEMLDRRIFERVESLWLQCTLKDPEISNGIDNSTTLKQYDYYKLCKRLSELMSENNDVISSIDVYLRESQILLSSYNDGRIKFVNENPNFIQEKFRIIVETGSVSGGWFASSDDGDNPEDEIITFYRTVPYLEVSTIPFKGYVAINVKEDALRNILQPEAGEKTYFHIIDKNGDFIFNSGKPRPGKKTIEEILTEKNKPYYTNCDGYIINSTVINSGNLYIVRMISDKVFFNRLIRMKVILWTICVLFALFGLGISIIFARQIYNPINRIVNNLRKFTEFENENHINEYSIIDSTINSLADKVTNLESEVLQGREAMRINDIVKLLSGEKTDIAEFDFYYRDFITAVITLYPYGGEYEEARCDAAALLENNPDKTDFRFVTTFENRIGVVANFESGKEQTVKLFMKELADKLTEKCGLVIAIGEKCTFDKIHVSYADAVRTLSYKFFTEDNVLCADDYLYRELSDTEFDGQLIKNFTTALKHENENEIFKTIDSLIDEIISSNCSYMQCRNRINSIFSVYFSYVLEENRNPNYAVTENTYSELNRSDTIFEFSEWFKNEIGEFLMKHRSTPHVETSDMMEVAKKIIEENLDKDLSLNFVADRLYIAPAYLSRIFKSETGENFNAYITNRRLELARKLITETNYSVNIITQKTGFNSATYLIKKFKEKYGQTPVNYKKNYIIGGEGRCDE